jgi:hypothetical protein
MFSVEEKKTNFVTEPVSLIITGQIKSRLGRVGGASTLVENLSMFKNLNPKNEVIFSTFEGEQVKQLNKIVDKLIINFDPGQDNYRTQPWPISRKFPKQSSNYTRMFKTAVTGLSASKNKYVIKTRIELVPENSIFFTNWLSNILNEIGVNPGKIGIFVEHYNGVNFSIDGTIGTLPSTLLVGEKQNLLNIYLEALDNWQKHFTILTSKKFLFPVTDEQILGLSYLKNLDYFDQTKIINKIKRYYISLRLIRALQRVENNQLIYTKYNESGFTKNYFIGTSYIKVPKKLYYSSRVYITRRVIIIILKRLRHITRRIKSGLFTF